jgi:hypothetical protein
VHNDGGWRIKTGADGIPRGRRRSVPVAALSEAHFEPERRGSVRTLDPDPAKNEGNAWLYPGGVAELRALVTERGLVPAPDDLRCLVAAMKGPLVDGALDDARAAARRFAAAL